MAPRRSRKLLKDSNLCRLPGKGYGPIHAIPLGFGYKELRELFLELLRVFSPPVEHDERPGDPMVPNIPRTKEFYPHGWDSTFHLMTPEQQNAASELYAAIGRSLDSAYGYGLDYGQDLLSQLARGDIRIGDFEKPHRKCKTCGRTLPTGGNICRYCNNEEAP